MEVCQSRIVLSLDWRIAEDCALLFKAEGAEPNFDAGQILQASAATHAHTCRDFQYLLNMLSKSSWRPRCQPSPKCTRQAICVQKARRFKARNQIC